MKISDIIILFLTTCCALQVVYFLAVYPKDVFAGYIYVTAKCNVHHSVSTGVGDYIRFTYTGVKTNLKKIYNRIRQCIPNDLAGIKNL